MSDGLRQRWHFVDRFGKPFVVTRWIDASSGERAAALEAWQARRALQQAIHEGRGERRADLVAICRTLSDGSFNLHAVAMHQLTRHVYNAVDRGLLLVLHPDAAADAGAQQDPVSVLVSQIMGARRDIPYEGRAYRIVTARNGRSVADTRDYRVVGHQEALAVIQGMLDRLPRTSEERGRWSALRDLLADDPKRRRVALVRVVPEAGGSDTKGTPTEPPSPAAQPPARPKKELSWIEVRVSYEDGAPYSGRVRLKLPNGASVDSSLDAGGILRLDGILPGTCEVVLLDLSERSRAS